MGNFDVFLSYSNEDVGIVSQLASALEGLGLRVWFDRNVLAPGQPWQRDLYEGILQSSATAVCIGSEGVGNWQQVEMEQAIAEQVEKGNHRVIPVLLPGVDSKAVQLSPFLKRNTWVQLRGDVSERTTLERLYWGVTGKKLTTVEKKPVNPARVPTEAVNDAISNLRDTLQLDNVTYFVGPAAAQAEIGLPPTPCEITRGLLLDLRLIEADYHHLLPPIDVVGSYYAARSGPTLLEGRVIEMIASRSTKLSKTHEGLAELIGLLADRPKPRIRSRAQQLIVTTNLDVMIERALLQRGISFTRFVQYTSAARIQMNQYRAVTVLPNRSIQLASNDRTLTARWENWDEVDDIIANYGKTMYGDMPGENPLPLHSLPLKELSGDGPVLYKFRGSQDVPRSCALSVDQYLNYTGRLFRGNCVPAQVTEILNTTPIVLFGYGYFDPDFRLIYHNLIRRTVELRQDPVYSVQVPPDLEQHDSYRQMELRLWDRVKNALRDLGVTTLECSGEEFLRMLIERLRQPRVA